MSARLLNMQEELHEIYALWKNANNSQKKVLLNMLKGIERELLAREAAASHIQTAWRQHSRVRRASVPQSLPRGIRREVRRMKKS